MKKYYQIQIENQIFLLDEEQDECMFHEGDFVALNAGYDHSPNWEVYEYKANSFEGNLYPVVQQITLL